jgi:hypothetical protein
MQTVLMKKAKKAATLIAIAAAVQAPNLTLDGSTVHTLAHPLFHVPEPSGYGVGIFLRVQGSGPFISRVSLKCCDAVSIQTTDYTHSTRTVSEL